MQAVHKGAEIIFACGGDGTIHEVVQALVLERGAYEAALGIIPLGSANALARHLRLSLDPVKAAMQQISGEPLLVPVGKMQFNAQARYFMVMAGAGPDGALVYKLLAAQKSSLGRLAYYLHAARLFATRRFHAFEVDYAETATGRKITQRAVSVMAVRVGSLGGLFGRLSSSRVGIRDCQLQLLILTPPSWLSLPLWFVCGWLGLRGLNPFFRAVNVRGFSCFPLSGPAAYIQADGEWLGRIPMEVSVVPNALRVLMPAGKRDKNASSLTEDDRDG
jgi:diacylglycerol kinase (ATP)